MWVVRRERECVFGRGGGGGGLGQLRVGALRGGAGEGWPAVRLYVCMPLMPLMGTCTKGAKGPTPDPWLSLFSPLAELPLAELPLAELR